MPVDKEKTLECLILAGERLIAQRGIEGVSLRQVNLEAGQKNTSAALYHFGTKEGLMMAIFDYRMAHVDQRRHDLLDQDESSIRDLIKAWIVPDIEEITEAEGGSYHARFLAVVCNHPEFRVQDVWHRPHAGSYQRLSDGLRRLLPNLSPQVFSMRFGMAMLQSIYAIADQERLMAADRESAINAPLFVSHLIDVMEAILTAPLSADTERELELATSRTRQAS